MFLNISIKSLIKSKILMGLFIIIILFLSIIIYKKGQTLLLGEKISLKNCNPLEATSYYAEYELTVISNKNINTYYMKEWFSQGKSRFEFLDKQNNKINIIINTDRIYIENKNEKNNLTFNNLGFANNVTSFSTIISLYNCIKNETNSCNCKLEEYIKQEKLNVYITLESNCNCSLCENIQKNNIHEIVVEMEEKNKTPLGINLLDKDKNVISSIVYTKFEINMNIDNSMFTIL